MRILKILAKLIFILIALIIMAMMAIPYFFKDEIIETIKTEVNDNLKAIVNFESVDLSLFKSFPDLYLGLKDLTVTGTDEFSDVQLIQTQSFEISVDIMSLFDKNGPVLINDIVLKNPKIKILVLKNGHVNCDIVKASDQTPDAQEAPAVFQINLQSYVVKNAQITYRDRLSNMVMTVDELDHSGSGDFTASIFNLNTKTVIKALSVEMDGINYLKKAKVSYDAIFNMNMDEMKFVLKENKLNINALSMDAEGWLQMKDNDILMKLAFNAPSNQFKDLLSLIPGAFIDGYENVKANGKFKFASSIDGTYNGNQEIYPAFIMDLEVDNANVQYPDLPFGISSINTKINVQSPSSDLDEIKLNVSEISFNMADNPFSGKLKLSRPISNPKMDMAAKGTIDFAVLSKAFPMEELGKTEGVLITDIQVKARLSDMENEDYENIQAKGFFNLTDFSLSNNELPRIGISSLKSNVTPRSINVMKMKGQFGKTDLDIKGNIGNYLAFFSPKKTMTGFLKMKSNLMDLNEWMPQSGIVDSSSQSVTIESTEQVFDRFDFAFDGDIKTLLFEDYKLENIVAKGRLTSNKFAIETYKMKIGKSDIQASGEINQLFEYLFDEGTLKGNIKLVSNLLDMNEIMGGEVDPNNENAFVETPVYPIPENIDMSIDVDINRVLYTNMDMQNLKGKVVIQDQKASLVDMTSNTLDGKIMMEGSYETKNIKKPAFNLNYRLVNIDFKKAFNTFNTFSKIAPIGKYMKGSFTTDMKMDGILGKGMMPDLMSINVDGFLQTFNNVLTNFLPMKKVAEKLNVKELNNMRIEDVKTWFTFKNGRIAVEEFPYKWKNIDMKIKGGHSFDASMDYDIKMKIPRDLIKNGTVNELADRGIGFLSGQASKLGLDINAVEFINVIVNITGSITDPKVGIKLLGTDGKGVNIVDKAKEEVKEVVEKAKDSVKTVVVEKIEDTKKELKEKADKEITNLMNKAKSAAQRTKNEGYKLAEEARKLGYEQADELVKKAGNNVFKKVAAKEASKVLKKETDKKVAQMKRETDKKADLFLKNAEREAEKIRQKYE